MLCALTKELDSLLVQTLRLAGPYRKTVTQRNRPCQPRALYARLPAGASVAGRQASTASGKELHKLDGFAAIFVDDIGYVQQSHAEMEVLFTFLAERYERKRVLISSNLVFSQWDRIFHDPMTTAAAIDRLVHHAIILEMTGP
jgi:DNA replication protein DnaC